MGELQKVLDKLGIQAKSKEFAGVPAHAFGRTWRITLIRKVGKGKEAKDVKFSVVYTTKIGEPTVTDIIESLATDAQTGEDTFWDFAQGYSGPTAEAERVYKACKRIGPRAKRFFGEPGWKTILDACGMAPSSANVKKSA